jgi:Putative  PD-(D/E)XK family member, (DUF4420)
MKQRKELIQLTLIESTDLIDESKAGYFAEILKNLPKSERPGLKIFRKSLFKHNGSDIYAARDELGFPYIFVPLADEAGIETKNISKGISVSEAYEVIDGLAPQRYLQFRCASLNADLVFGAICNSLCQTMVDVSQPTSKILSDVSRIVNEWRELLASLIPSEPSKTEIIGLFGELCTLILASKKLGIHAMDAWFGSDRTRHDFEFANLSVETKATTSSTSKLVTINGFQQLEQSANLPLRLVRFSLDEAQGAYTIGDLLDILTAMGYTNTELDGKLATFDENVASSRPDWCAKRSYRINIVEVYEIDEHFPRLRIKDLNPMLQEKLTSVEYKINLSGLDSQTIHGGNLDDIAERIQLFI